MLDWLRVDNVAFTVMGYPMSWIELVGTLLYLASVWLIARRNLWTWPIGIVSVLLFMALFYQIRLYADALEQVYYLGTSVYGWAAWSRAKETEEIAVKWSASRTIWVVAGATLCLSILSGFALMRVHRDLPVLFPEPAAYPFLDALTTVMSFSAMLLLALRRVESWVYWILVDVIGIGLYFAKGVILISILYVILLCMATRGLSRWRRPAR